MLACSSVLFLTYSLYEKRVTGLFAIFWNVAKLGRFCTTSRSPNGKSMASRSDATRASLIFRAKGHDSQAWSESVDLYGPLITHWCYRCGLDSGQAADVVQDVFVALSKSLDTYEAGRGGAFRAWLWRISSNKIRDFLRRERGVIPAQGGSTAMVGLQQLPEESVPEQDPTDPDQVYALLQRGLEQVRNEFETRTWQIFERNVIDQIANALVAREFQVTDAAVRQTRGRILRRLRQQLGDLDAS